MSFNRLSRFAMNASTTYVEGSGLRYTDSYWGSENGPSAHNTGFVPNTTISPIQINTLFAQTTLVSYIIGSVLADNTIIKDKSGNALITEDIDSTNTDADQNYIDGFKSFLNRINDIRGNREGIGTESVWRSRQLANGDNTDSTNYGYWSVNNQGHLTSSNSTQRIYVYRLYGQATSGTSYIEPGTNQILMSPQVNIQGSFGVTGNVNIGTDSSNTLVINSNSDFYNTIIFKGNSTVYLGEVDGGNTSSNNRSTFNLWSRYNEDGTNNTYTSQSLETILYNIGTRLDTLGFKQGMVETETGWSTISENYCYRQGNYCIIRLVGYINYTYIDSGTLIFKIPENFLPSSSYSCLIAITTGEGGGNTCILNIQPNGNATLSAEDGGRVYATGNIQIQLGHICSPI